MEWTFDQAVLDALPPLTSGAHDDGDDCICAMEALARACGLGTTDAPECCSPVIAAAVRVLNDSMPDDETRDRLIRPLLPLMVGTSGDGGDQARAFIAADFGCRVFAPLALGAAGLTDEATKLRNLAVVVDIKSAASAAESAAESAESAAASAAESAASAAWSAASAASSAAESAESAASAAWSAAWSAAESAAESAASSAAWKESARMTKAMCKVGR